MTNSTYKPRKRPAMNREAWLTTVAHRCVKAYTKLGFEPAETAHIRVSCGWPWGKSYRVKGECWGAHLSQHRHSEIFISPRINDELEVAAVIAHEVAHTIEGTQGHCPVFARAIRAIGLVGKPTQSNPGQRFIEGDLFKGLGPYPHGILYFHWEIGED